MPAQPELRCLIGQAKLLKKILYLCVNDQYDNGKALDIKIPGIGGCFAFPFGR